MRFVEAVFMEKKPESLSRQTQIDLPTERRDSRCGEVSFLLSSSWTLSILSLRRLSWLWEDGLCIDERPEVSSVERGRGGGTGRSEVSPPRF